MGSEKSMVKVRNAWPRLSPSATLVATSVGGKVSGTRSIVIGALVVTLPPVSVART